MQRHTRTLFSLLLSLVIALCAGAAQAAPTETPGTAAYDEAGTDSVVTDAQPLTAMLKIRHSRDDAQVRGRLTRIRQQAGNLRPVMREGAEYMDEQVAGRFERERDPEGVRWRPLKPATVRRKVRLGQSTKILTAEGTLQGQVKHRPLHDGLQQTSDLHYDRVHDRGLRAGRGRGHRMPQRRFSGFSLENRRHLCELVRAHVFDPA